MSEQVELTNPVELSVGGMKGHIFRRGIHVGMVLLPWIYFEHGEMLSEKYWNSKGEPVDTIEEARK